jgi:hypothetical protein
MTTYDFLFHSVRYPCDIPQQCSLYPEIILNWWHLLLFSLLVFIILYIFCSSFRKFINYFIMSGLGGDFGFPAV